MSKACSTNRTDWKRCIPSDAIDIYPGKVFPFKYRIVLGEIFNVKKGSKAKTELQLLEECFLKLYDIDKPVINRYTIEHVENLLKGLVKWVELENRKLHLEPTADEKAAGRGDIDELGYFNTIKALAERFSKDFDDILNWDYNTVFNILWSDAEQAKYQRRYDRLMQRKSEGGKSWTKGRKTR